MIILTFSLLAYMFILDQYFASIPLSASTNFLQVLAVLLEFQFAIYLLYFIFLPYLPRTITTTTAQSSLFIFWVSSFYFFYIYPKNFLYINYLLYNPIVGIHPPIFIFIFYLFLYLAFFYFFHINITFFIVVSRVLIMITWLFLLTSVSNFLGCWWAYQEFYWGGWWSWEVSELLLLFFINSLLWFIHTSNHMHTNKFYSLLLFFLSSLLFYLQLLNFFFSFNLHSFFSEAITPHPDQLLVWIAFCGMPTIYFKKSNFNFNFFWPSQLWLLVIFLIEKVFLYYFIISLYLTFIFYRYPANHLIIFILLLFVLYMSFFYLF